MDLVLHLPGLLARRDAGARAPGFARLVAVAESKASEPDGAGAALAARFGVSRQRDWPLAPLRLAAQGIDPGASYWLLAEPVTLVAGRDDVRLTGAVADLTPDDAARLVAALNAHFAGDGLAFVAPRPDAWFVRAPAPARLATRPLAVAVNQPLRGLLPTGEDAPTWRRWGHEIEMLLHEHPVNAARADAGRPAVSALWFSFGGVQPPVTGESAVRTFARDGDAVALSRHAGAPTLPPPATLGDAILAAAGAHTLVVAPGRDTDLATVDAAWLCPAYTALIRRALAAVTLIGDGDAAGGATCWTVRRPGPWRRLVARFGASGRDARFAPDRDDR